MAKKKIESEARLEKICKKLAVVPASDWKEAMYDASAGRKGFTTTLNNFIFEIYGSVRRTQLIPGGKVITAELHVYDEDKVFTEHYTSSLPQLCAIYYNLVNKGRNGEGRLEAEKKLKEAFGNFLDS